MKNLPGTVKHPDAFIRSPAAGFDGVFDWSWTNGCFGSGNITPMDFDGVIERKGNFLVMETKDIGVTVPHGQMITFDSAHKLGVFTILFIEGKDKPKKVKAWFPNGDRWEKHRPVDTAYMKKLCSRWYAYADSNPQKSVDVRFLNRRIINLESIHGVVKNHLECAVKEMGGCVTWKAEYD